MRGQTPFFKMGSDPIRFIAFFVLLSFLLSGCSPEWKKKFIRRRKNVAPPQPILVLQSDIQATHPPEVRYQAHFAYWKSWHSELLASLGQIRKRDIRYLDGVMGELRAMVELLSGPPGERLKKILAELAELEESWKRKPEPWQPTPAMHSRLEQIKREIDRELHYSKVKEWIPHGMSGSKSS